VAGRSRTTRAIGNTDDTGYGPELVLKTCVQYFAIKV
jgi:hypothetical protein